MREYYEILDAKYWTNTTPHYKVDQSETIKIVAFVILGSVFFILPNIEHGWVLNLLALLILSSCFFVLRFLKNQ